MAHSCTCPSSSTNRPDPTLMPPTRVPPCEPPGGVLVVELAPDQGEDAVAAAWQAGFEHAETRRDLVGRIRMLVARMPG